MTTDARACLLLVLVAGAACGGTGGAVTYTLIDDMEGDGNRILWSPSADAKTGWWTPSIDCTQADRISPPPSFADPHASPYETLPAPSETFAGVTSTSAIRFRTTTPLVGIWGASIVANLASDTDEPSPPLDDAGGPPWGSPCRQATARDFPAPTVDLTPYSGITFWAKSAGGSRSLRFDLQDRNTDPRGGLCNAVDEANCYNGFDDFVVLSDSFTRYTIDFSALAQDGHWGYRPNPSVPDLAHVYALNFQFDACIPTDTIMCAGGEASTLSFDFWLDDLYLVNR